MDNALFVGLSRQMVLRREMDIVANNIANADTVGFKVESLVSKTDAKAPARNADGRLGPVKFVTADGVARDFSQGAMARTDNPLDVAIEGQAFFKVQTANGERYTRDGHFKTDQTGRLTTAAGAAISDEGGGEIVIDPEKGQVSIAPDGSISQGAERIGKIGLFRFDSLSTLEKTGDNLFQNTSNQQGQIATDARLRQGMLEGSNVKPVLEISRMIEVSRAYEQIARIMDSNADLSKTAVQRMGRVQ